jgi:hypothetical protein
MFSLHGDFAPTASILDRARDQGRYLTRAERELIFLHKEMRFRTVAAIAAVAVAVLVTAGITEMVCDRQRYRPAFRAPPGRDGFVPGNTAPYQSP